MGQRSFATYSTPRAMLSASLLLASRPPLKASRSSPAPTRPSLTAARPSLESSQPITGSSLVDAHANYTDHLWGALMCLLSSCAQACWAAPTPLVLPLDPLSCSKSMSPAKHNQAQISCAQLACHWLPWGRSSFHRSWGSTPSCLILIQGQCLVPLSCLHCRLYALAAILCQRPLCITRYPCLAL